MSSPVVVVSANGDDILHSLISQSITNLVNTPTTIAQCAFINASLENVGCFTAEEAPIPSHWHEDATVDAGLFMDAGDLGGQWQRSITDANQRRSNRWLADEAQRVLEQAYARLDLPTKAGENEPVDRPELMRMGRHELQVEKKRVKHELKRYDTLFKQNFDRLPTRWEKEPMRPLYTYYRKLKQLLGQWEGRGGAAPQSIPENDLLPAGQAKTPDDSKVTATTHAMSQITISSQPSGSTVGAGAGAAGAYGPRADQPQEQPASKRSAGHGDQQTPTSSVVTADAPADDSVAGAEARLSVLNKEKNAIRNKLQKYQEKFIAENRRKIRYHRDILPIEREYRMYKHIKEEIARVESICEKQGGSPREKSPGSDLGGF